MQLLGIDHFTSITASREECLDFYVGILDLDLASSPIADAAGGDICFGDGREGSLVLRFVDAPGASTGTAGAGMVHGIRWWVSGRQALEQWAARFELFGVATAITRDAAGNPVALRFSDPEGRAHHLLSEPGDQRLRRPGVEPTPGLPPALRLAGVHAVVAESVPSPDLPFLCVA